MTKAIRRLFDFDFTNKDAHIALVDVAANGTSILVKKNFSDFDKFDRESGEFVPLTESGLRVNMSLEDILMFFTNLFPEDIETLTASITKAADGKELGDLLEESVKKTQVIPIDVFSARRQEFQEKLASLDAEGMNALREASKVIKEFLDRGTTPGETDDGSPTPDNVEKTMTDEEKAAAALAKSAEENGNTSDVSEGVPADVQKALDESKATITKQDKQIEALQKAEDNRTTATFITKAAGYVTKGATLPEVEEGKDATNEFGLALKTLSVAAPEAYAQVESVLEKAFDTIEKGANLESVGGDGEPELSDNATNIAKAATEIRKNQPELTEEEAVAKALDDNPELYQG